ncbi:histidinol-phosphate transaminase [Gilvimarinus sp. F26214L]|uniref:histidinol-phosphate transaminase n=1 Tax=Gilvimarinus sp. DZF01 TaxID=3461371 RepID=UPI004045D740
MSQYWSDIVHQLTPYVPGEQPKLSNLVKLNTNESPYGPSPAVIAAMQAALGDELRLYPDPGSDGLKRAIARYYDLQPEQVFVGNGSDEILAHTFKALLKHREPLLFPDISYSFYPVYCKLYEIEARPVPLRDDFSIAVDDFHSPNGGVILPNPNAPTGRLLPLSDIEALLQANSQSVVVIDEAYIDFGGESAASLVTRYPNLLVIQTLSKSRALAGLRVGFALGDAGLIEGLERVKDSFNSYPLGRVAQAGAIAAMEDREYFETTCAKVIATRETLSAGLTKLGFEVIPSAANFVFTRRPGWGAADLAARLREDGIIVRHFRQPRVEDYLRISVGTDAEIERLLASLQHILAG